MLSSAGLPVALFLKRGFNQLKKKLGQAASPFFLDRDGDVTHVFAKKIKNGTKSTRKNLNSAFMLQFTLALLEISVRVSGGENVGSKLQMDSVIRLRTSGSFSSLEKTKAKKKKVQVMEFLIYPSNNSLGRERRQNT